MARALPEVDAVERLRGAAKLLGSRDPIDARAGLELVWQAIDEILVLALPEARSPSAPLPHLQTLLKASNAFRASLEDTIRQWDESRDWLRGEWAKLDAGLAEYEAERRRRADVAEGGPPEGVNT